MKTVKLILCLVILAAFIAGVLSSCVSVPYICPTYAKGAPTHKASRI